MKIAVCGSPAAGKTTIAKILASKINFEYVDLNKLIIDNSLYEYYDEFYQSYIVDEDKLNSFLENFLDKDKNYVIDGILSYLIDADLYIVIKVDPNVLRDRLEERNYPFHKIFENVWAENMGIIEEELERKNRNFIVLYNNKQEDIERIVNEIIKIIKKGT